MSRFQHRANVYSRRLLRTAMGRGLRQRCVFLHMPKCGGTALAEGLYGTVGVAHRVGVIDAVSTRRAAAQLARDVDDPLLCHEDLPLGHLTFELREGIALTHLAWTTRLIHGHILATPRLIKALGHECRLVTMMRDPGERTLSNYRMAVRAGVIADDLDGWLEGPVAVSMAQVYLRYLSGQNVIAPEEEAASVTQAWRHLERFDVVGFLDQPDRFAADFKRVFGVRPHLPRRNVGHGTGATLSPRQRDRLERLLGPDRTLYAAARALHDGEDTTPEPRRPARCAAGTPTRVQH